MTILKGAIKGQEGTLSKVTLDWDPKSETMQIQ